MDNGALCAKMVKWLPFWGHLSEAEKQMICARATVLRYQAGRLVRDGNRDCLGILLIQKGILRTYLLSEDGRQVTIYRQKQGDVCVLTASCVMDAVTFEMQVDAEEDTEVILIPIDVYGMLVRDNIHVECFSYRAATERFSDVVVGMERMVFLTLEQRLAVFLLDEAAQGETVNMTHEQMASAIGSAREAVSRTLKQLAVSGAVELYRGGVRILDRGTLQAVIA